MSGIVIPGDRTVKQRSFGVCMNRACLEKNTDERFTFQVENDHFACPKCGADKPPLVGMLALIHFLIPDKTGPLEGAGGLRYRFGCDSTRAYMATHTNQEACSGQIEAVNCIGCLQEAQKLKLTNVGFAMLAKPA